MNEIFKKISRLLSGLRSGFKVGGVFIVECRDKDGNLKWRDVAKNLVVNAGLNGLLDIMFHASTQVTTWYVGLTGSSPSPAAADTMSSHSGWTEFTSYSESTRVAYNEAAASSQSITNSANVAAFSINGTGTVGGAFLVSESTKSGTSGTLFCCAAFSQGNKSVSSGDTVNVTYTLNAADDGA